MIIGDRLRAIREAKKLSQGDIADRAGLLRGYISRVENNRTVPAVETLERFARALKIPLYQLFYDGEGVTPLRFTRRIGKKQKNEFPSSRKDTRIWAQFCEYLPKISQHDREMLLQVLKKMAKR
jgi:transcriptional regulator with XRE-family HTH domain